MSEVEKAMADFICDYWDEKSSMATVSISKVAVMMKKDSTEPVQLNKSIDDFCLSVGLKQQPSQDLKLPDVYKNVRVFYEVVGEMRLQ